MNQKFSAKNNNNDDEPPAQQRLILLVEASEKNRTTIARTLTSAGYRVHAVRTGEHALRMMEECPDLVLLSEKLPDLPGYEVCRSLKSNAQCARMPIILTAPIFKDEADTKDRTLCGADVYLTLPIDPLVLLSIVKMTLRTYEDATQSKSLLIATEKLFEEELATEHHRLKTSEYELAQFIALSPIPMAIYRGPEHVYALANNAEHKILRTDVLGKRASDVNHEFPEFIKRLDQVYQTGEPYISKETHYGLKNEEGKPESAWFNEWLYPFRNVEGNVAGVLGVGQNVTEHVLARQEVSAMLNALPALIARVNTEKQIVYVNENNESYFDAPKDILGKTLAEYFGTHYASFKDNAEAALGGKAVQFEWASPTLRDGLTHNFLVNFAPLYSPEGDVNGFVASAFNIDNLKSVESKLKKAKDEVEVQNTNLEDERDIRERFVATLSHDLRNPLAAARMNAELLAHGKVDHVETKKLSVQIIECMDEMDDMIRNMLDANLIRAGEKLPMRIKEDEINTIVKSAISELTTIHGDRFVLEASQAVRGYWDSTAVRRAIENLCCNAVKYGNAEPIRVLVSDLPDEDAVEIAVQNWGPLIEQEELETIFNYYRRQKRARIGGYAGWGIGLTIVRGVAEAHGGTVVAESSEENGTIFRIKLLRDARTQLESK